MDYTFSIEEGNVVIEHQGTRFYFNPDQAFTLARFINVELRRTDDNEQVCPTCLKTIEGMYQTAVSGTHVH